MELDTIIQLLDSPMLVKSLATLLVFTLMLLLRRVLLGKIKRRDTENRRHLINTIKQFSNGLLFIVLVLIWSSEVQHLAISVAAFMVAIVLATREFLQCILGFFYYLFTRPFRAGDWIEIDGKTTGEVYSLDWLKVTLLEVDRGTLEYTGRTAYVPNNQMVTKQLRNLNFMRRYSMHSFVLTLGADPSLIKYLDKIELIVRSHCNGFRDVAVRYKEKIERHMETEFIHVDPVVNVKTSGLALTELHIHLFCPTDEAAKIQNLITCDILGLLPAASEHAPAKPSALGILGSLSTVGR